MPVPHIIISTPNYGSKHIPQVALWDSNQKKNDAEYKGNLELTERTIYTMQNKLSPPHSLAVGLRENGSHVNVPFSARCGNFLVLSITSPGITSCQLLGQDIADHDMGMVLVTTNRDLAWVGATMAKLNNRPFTLFDTALDTCPFYNPMLGPEDEVVARMVDAAMDANPDLPQYFKDLCETCIRNAVPVLKRLDDDRGTDGFYSTLSWLSRLLENQDGQGRELVTRFSRIFSDTPGEAKQNADIAAWFQNEYFAEDSKVFADSSYVRTLLKRICDHYQLGRPLNPDTEKGEYNEVDFEAVSRNGGVVCVVLDPDSLRLNFNPMRNMIMDSLAAAIQKRDNDCKPLSVYIDPVNELLPAAYLHVLENSEKYRIANHLFIKGLDLLDARLGEGGADKVLGLVKNYMVFAACLATDAKRLMKTFGDPPYTGELHVDGVYIHAEEEDGSAVSEEAQMQLLDSSTGEWLLKRAKEAFASHIIQPNLAG